MAYRFTQAGVSRTKFAATPLNGNVFGPYTYAFLVKRANTSNFHSWLGIWNAAGGTSKMHAMTMSGASGERMTRLSEGAFSALVLFGWDTSKWTLVVMTCPGAGSHARFHYNTGGAWVHANGTTGSVWADVAAVLGTDIICVSPPAAWGGEYLDADVVCAGIKKSDSSDAQVETLSRTRFSTWKNFGFHWLVGFDRTENILTDIGATRDGDEDFAGRNSISLVSDPPGWNWGVLGNSTSRSSSVGGAVNRKVSWKFTLPFAGILNELHAWVDRDPGGSANYVVHIYSDVAGEPGALIAYTNTINLAAGSDSVEIGQTGFSTPLAAGDYWVGVTGSNLNSAFRVAGTGTTLRRIKDSVTLFPPSSTFGVADISSSGANNGSAWADVDMVSDPVFTPILDDFNRANENPLTKGGEWLAGQAFTFGSDTLKVVSNRLTVNSTFGLRAWATPMDGLVFAALAGVITGVQLFLFLRNATPGAGATGAYTLYLRWNPTAGTHYLQLGRTNGSGITMVAPSGGGDASVNSVFSGEIWALRVYNVDAATVRVEAWRGVSTNMTLFRTFDDTTAGRIMTAGYGGIGLGEVANDADDFGGTVTVVPSTFVPRVMSIY